MILQGDCLDRLKELPADSVDALITDPPAGISFMGKAWDDDKGGRRQWIAWMTEVMAECHRVLKPGAHGLVWAIPRTSHWTGAALEDAGFEVRDVVTHLFGSGYPKSLDISKAIDKAAGAQREVIGRYESPEGTTGLNSKDDQYGYGMGDMEKRVVTAPATDAAKQWQGYGTALKPAAEFWFLVRKPISENTVAANVLKWGCGGLNIDGTRILSDGKRPDSQCTCEETQGDLCASTVARKTGRAGAEPSTVSVATNVAAIQSAAASTTHSDGSTQEDMFDLSIGMMPRESTATSLSTVSYGASQSKEAGSSITKTETAKTTASKTCNACGLRTMSGITSAASQGRFPANLVLSHSPHCTDDACDMFECPVALLDEQSGKLRARGNITAKDYGAEYNASSYRMGGLESGFTGDSGGASRFFYCAKTSTAERNAGLDDLPDVHKRSAGGTTSSGKPTMEGRDRFGCITKNHHPTVKPQKLMRYLCRLITPPKGTVLDPFMGSGSTGVAAKAEGFEFIGIEREPEYITIAEKRIDHVSQAP